MARGNGRTLNVKIPTAKVIKALEQALNKLEQNYASQDAAETKYQKACEKWRKEMNKWAVDNFNKAENIRTNYRSWNSTLNIDFEIDDSVLRLQIKNGGTESGTYSTALPIIKSNSMSNTPAVASGMTMTTGGTHSGGNVLMLEKISATKNGALIQEDQLIGLPSGNHFVYIENVGNQSINGLIVMRWSEY